eukprot:TRINITY_DN8783_c0_g1_i8.p2 TRINITY_DN8783_c0_g1~~TRINITY_DN8783_c0_g1_i8.p2  ORF type:complete len:121 (-),score=28.05 TRINITY_DN8783_c0_g1_i8:185-547(-)
MKQACNLVLQNLYHFSYKPTIQFMYAALKCDPNRVIPSNNNIEVKQVSIEKQEKPQEKQQQQTQQIMPNIQQQPIISIYSIIESYKTPMTQNEIDIINLCGPIVGFEEPKKDNDKKKKKK